MKILTEILCMLDPDSFSSGQRVRACLKDCVHALKLTGMWELDLAAMFARIGRVTMPPCWKDPVPVMD